MAIGRADRLQNGTVKLLQGKEAKPEDLSAVVVTILQGMYKATQVLIEDLIVAQQAALMTNSFRR